MDSLVAFLVVLVLVAGIGRPQLQRAFARVEHRLRTRWTWRNGRERAAMRGVIHC